MCVGGGEERREREGESVGREWVGVCVRDVGVHSLLISPAMSIFVDSCSNDAIVLWMSSTFSCLFMAPITWAVEPIAWAIFAWDCIVYTNKIKIPLLAKAVPRWKEESLRRHTCIWCPVEVILELMLSDFAFCCRSLTSCLAYTAHVWGAINMWTISLNHNTSCSSYLFVTSFCCFLDFCFLRRDWDKTTIDCDRISGELMSGTVGWMI